MTSYRATTELKTPWWLRLLRFLRIKNKREEFLIVFEKDWYNKGDIIRSDKHNILILGYGNYGNLDVD